jgi:hypothetical protein
LIFNLGQQQVFKSQGGKYGGIYCKSDNGPHYGYGPELGAYYEPFNGHNKCISYANRTGYRIPKEGGNNRLTNKKDEYFTITELEVWQITEMVSNYN